MIAKDITSYPCLAVIKNFHVHETLHGRVYEMGRGLLEAYLEWDQIKLMNAITMEDLVIFGRDAMGQLFENYTKAAREFHWGPFG